MNSYFVSQTNQSQPYSSKRHLTFSQLGWSKIGIRWNLKTMWLTFWPKIQKTNSKVHQFDTTTCKQYHIDVKMQMNIVYDNIQYLPYELDHTDIKRYILHQNPKVYPILKAFCQEYNRLIKTVDFLFKIKKQASQFVDNQPELSVQYIVFQLFFTIFLSRLLHQYFNG
eukprot:38710_1